MSVRASCSSAASRTLFTCLSVWCACTPAEDLALCASLFIAVNSAVVVIGGETLFRKRLKGLRKNTRTCNSRRSIEEDATDKGTEQRDDEQTDRRTHVIGLC